MLTATPQLGILQPVPTLGRSLTFRMTDHSVLQKALADLRELLPAEAGVVGLGVPVVEALGVKIPGLHSFPDMTNPRCTVPATQEALWVFLRGQTHDALFENTERIKATLAPAFGLVESLDTFMYEGGRDLTGYEDGTENPRDDAAVAAAIVAAENGGLPGSSFAAVQKWRHDLAGFRRRPKVERDYVIGREQESNEELEEAPDSAHVKRTAQEDFEPPAFMVRRSMPWDNGAERGLLFIAYVNTLSKYEAVMRRMAGFDDGVIDGLFSFSEPLTGGYYWCPPLRDGKLDLAILGV